MIHFPIPWLDLLKTMAMKLQALEHCHIAELADAMRYLEFDLHMSLFAVRKIDESIGVPLGLKSKHLQLQSWPSTEAGRQEIKLHSDPPVHKWYNLKNPETRLLSYADIINMFVHARICNVGCVMSSEDRLNGDGIVSVASDKVMRDRHFQIKFAQLARILRHTINVFEPIVKKRQLRQFDSNSIESVRL